MTRNKSYFEKFEHYEEQFDPLKTDRKGRRKRKAKVNHIPKATKQKIVTNLVDDTVGLEGGFKSTYKPARYEKEWLLASLQPFYDQGLIADILAQIKGGKEASVYRCQADVVEGKILLAAKVYRPRKFRNLRNDALYREGRTLLKVDGKAMKKKDHRIIRAVDKKTRFGAIASHTSWLMYEFTTLQTLYQVGAAVPEPIAASENAILMSYHGDAYQAASALNEISLPFDEAEELFDEVLANIKLFLQHNLVHGDLSAYNILYWQGKITIIDFPQVVDSQRNPKAQAIFERDVQRVCEYFIRQGVACDPVAIADDLWTTYNPINIDDRLADLSRHDEEEGDLNKLLMIIGDDDDHNPNRNNG